MLDSPFNWVSFFVYAGAGVFAGQSFAVAIVVLRHGLSASSIPLKILTMAALIVILPGFWLSAKVFLNTAPLEHTFYVIAFVIGVAYAIGTGRFVFVQASNSRLQATP